MANSAMVPLYSTAGWGCMQVAGAINKAKKAEIVGNLTEKLQASTLVFGMEYQGITVRIPALGGLCTS